MTAGPQSSLEWLAAYEHLQEVRRIYVDVGAAGVPALSLSLNPLLLRYARGERTPELHAEMLAAE